MERKQDCLTPTSIATSFLKTHATLAVISVMQNAKLQRYKTYLKVYRVFKYSSLKAPAAATANVSNPAASALKVRHQHLRQHIH